MFIFILNWKFDEYIKVIINVCFCIGLYILVCCISIILLYVKYFNVYKKKKNIGFYDYFYFIFILKDKLVIIVFVLFIVIERLYCNIEEFI